MRVLRSFAAASAVLAVGFLGGALLGVGCSENVESGTRRADVCQNLGLYSRDSWVVFAFGPLVILVMLMLFGPARARPWRSAAVILLLTLIADGILIAAIN